MATTRIKVHQLTDGVDGELITWDASGHPTTVATGTAGHVLTSNGTGAAPTFQAIASPITASNGLALASNNITLGGSLTAVTTLTGDATNYITITSTRATSSNASLIVNNTSSDGTALKTLASGTGAGIWGQSTTGTGVYGSSQSISVGGYSNGTIGTLFTIETAVTNTVLNSMVLDRNVLAGAGADGIGNKITFRNETSTTASVDTNTIVSKWSAATHASRLSEFSITGYNVAVENTLLTLSGNGAARLNKYGAGTFTGTAVKTLQVDASGNIIEGSPSGGGLSDADYGDITVSGSGTVMTIDNLAVTNAKINSMDVSKLTSGTVATSFTMTANTASTIRLNYNGGATGVVVDTPNNSTTLFSNSGSQFVSVDNTSVKIGAGTSQLEYVGGELRIYDSDITQYIGLKTPATANLTASYSLTLPQNDGTASGQVLTTDGAGVLSWTTPGDVLIGGNTTAADMSIGTNSTFGLNLETNGTTRIGITSVGVISIGQGIGQRITVNTTASSTSGGIELISNGTSAGTDVGVKITGAAFTASGNDNKVVQITSSYTRATGASGAVTSLAINPTANFTGSASGGIIGIDVSPTLTSLASGNFYGLYLNYSDAKAWGVYQNGANTVNAFQGKTAIGSTTTPTESLNITGNMLVAGQYASTSFAATDAAPVAINWNNGNVQYVTIAANRTVTFANPKEGARYVLAIKQPAGGSKTITWPTITWRGGTAPTLTTTANKTDLITLIYINGVYYGDASLNY